MLADGTGWTAGAPLSVVNALALYQPLYGGKGSVAVNLHFRDQANVSDADGVMLWSMPGRSAGFYKAGFAGQFSVVASIYSAPAPGTRALESLSAAGGDAHVSLRGGEVGVVAPIGVNLSLANKFTATPPNPRALVLSVAPKSGLLADSFNHPGDGKVHKLRGVLFEKQGRGSGFYFGTATGGAFDLNAGRP